jgi:hypothetical protein
MESSKMNLKPPKYFCWNANSYCSAIISMSVYAKFHEESPFYVVTFVYGWMADVVCSLAFVQSIVCYATTSINGFCRQRRLNRCTLHLLLTEQRLRDVFILCWWLNVVLTRNVCCVSVSWITPWNISKIIYCVDIRFKTK